MGPLCWWGPRETAQRVHAFRRHWNQGRTKRGSCAHPSFFKCVWGQNAKKPSPHCHTHSLLLRWKMTHFWGGGNRNSWNICMEAEHMQWITMCFACQFCKLTPTYSSWLLKLPLSVHLKSLPPPPLSDPLLYLCIWTVQHQNS
jgi:hypothetical protein